MEEEVDRPLIGYSDVRRKQKGAEAYLSELLPHSMPNNLPSPSMYMEDNWRNALYGNRYDPEHRAENPKALAAVEDTYAIYPPEVSFENDPHRFDIRMATEAGQLWKNLPPDVGPVLRRAGGRIPLYPEPLEPELFKPDKKLGQTFEEFWGRSVEKEKPGPVGSIDLAGEGIRSHVELGRADKLLRHNEGQTWATGDIMVDRHDKLDNSFRPFLYVPQKSVPMEFREGGADLSQNQHSSNIYAPLGLFDPARNASTREFHRRPYANSSTAQAQAIFGEVDEPRRFAKSITHAGNPHAATSSEAERGMDVDRQRRGEVFDLFGFVQPNKSATTHAEAMRGDAYTLRAYKPYVNAGNHFGAAGTSNAGFVGPSNARGRNIALTKELTQHVHIGDPRLGFKSGYQNVEMPFTTTGNLGLFAAQQATPAGPLGTAHQQAMNAANNTLVWLPDGSMRLATQMAYAGGATAADANCGAGRNTEMQFTSDGTIYLATQHSSVPVPGGGINHGEPGYWNTKVIERSGDINRALLSERSSDRPIIGSLAIGSNTDETLNPRHLDMTNRSVYTECATRPGGASAVGQAPIGQEPPTVFGLNNNKVMYNGAPEPILMAAFQDNPFVAVTPSLI